MPYFYNVILAIALAVLLSACGQDPSAQDFAVPRLGAVTAETEAFQAYIACPVSGSTAGVSAFGIRIGEASNSVALREAAATLQDGRLTAVVKALSPETDYRVEAWMTNGAEILTTETVVFRTKKGDAVVEIPDPVFQRYLLDNFDLNGDGVLTEPEALQIREITVCTDSIYSLKGLEKMSRLTHLTADGSNWGHGHLPDVDLSGNPLLEYCHLESNLLHTVDISKNPLLVNFSVCVNPLDSIEFSHNLKLREIGINCTDLTFIPEMTFIPHLGSIHMAEVARYLTEDYLRNYPELYSTNISNFTGKRIDLSQNPYLNSLWCENAPNIEEIDLTASTCKTLDYLCLVGCPNLRRVLLRQGTDIKHLTKDSHTELVYQDL